MKLYKPLMFGIAIAVSVCFAMPALATGTPDKNFPSLLSTPSDAPVLKRTADSLYDNYGLGAYGLQRDVFFYAYKGHQFLKIKSQLKKTNLLTIADYSQSSNNKRLYVIDLESGRMLFNTYVSHGKNSGDEFATSFSNLTSSNKSSLGFMVTAETYTGKAGLSMRFYGMEKGINDNVRTRDIVLHGSRYVNESIINNRGLIGNSLGCPAVPFGLHNRIINTIKDGSCFYVHHTDTHYTSSSAIIKAKFDLDPASVALQQGVAGPVEPQKGDGVGIMPK